MALLDLKKSKFGLFLICATNAAFSIQALGSDVTSKHRAELKDNAKGASTHSMRLEYESMSEVKKVTEELPLMSPQRHAEQIDLSRTSVEWLFSPTSKGYLGLKLIGTKEQEESSFKYSNVEFSTRHRIYRASRASFSVGSILASGTHKSDGNTLSRGLSESLGLLAGVSIDASVLEIGTDIGYRYRHREEFYSLVSVGDEIFYSTSLTNRSLENLEFSASIDGRRIIIVELLDYDLNVSRIPTMQSDLRFGMTYIAGQSEWEVFATKGIGEDSQAQGKSSFGLNATYRFGQKYRSDVTFMESNSDETREKGLNGLAPANLEADIENISNSDKADKSSLDEFQLAGERTKKRAKVKKSLSDEEAVTLELERLRETERKQKVAEERRRRQEEARSQKQSKKSLSREKAEISQLKNEVRKDVEVLPTVEDEDVKWNGLENR